MLLALTAIGPCHGGDLSFAEQAQQRFMTNRVRLSKEPDSVEACWNFGKSAFDWAEFAENDDQRAQIAKQGIAACRKAVTLNSESAAAHYYLAMNLGQLARTKRLSGLSIVDEMEVEFKRVIQLDERFDYAGPERCLGQLYLDAPGWPVSVGSRHKARIYLERAEELFPDYPENRLTLLEAYVKWGDKKGIEREMRMMEQVFARAKDQFKGDEWKQNWLDWNGRWSRIQRNQMERQARQEKRGD